MKNKGGKVIETIITIIVVILLCVMLFIERTVPYPFPKDITKKEAAIDEPTTEAEEVSVGELDQLKARLVELEEEKAGLYVNVPSNAMVGFIPTSSDDVSVIHDLTQEYDFKPVMILDCALGADTLEGLMDRFESYGWEIMFTMSMISDDEKSAFRSVKRDLAYYSLSDSGAVLLGKNDHKKDMITELKEEGALAYSFHSKEVEAPSFDQELISFRHVVVKNEKTKYEDYLDAAINNHSTLLTVFDLNNYHDDSLTEDQIKTSIAVLDKKVESGDIAYVSIAEMLEELPDYLDEVEEPLTALEEEQASIEEQITVLENEETE